MTLSWYINAVIGLFLIGGGLVWVFELIRSIHPKPDDLEEVFGIFIPLVMSIVFILAGTCILFKTLFGG